VTKKKASRRKPAPQSKTERAAELRRELARLERNPEPEDEDEDEDEGEDEGGGRHGLTLAEKGQGVVRAIEQGLSALGGLGRLMVGDETTPNENGDSVKFARHAGHVRGVRLDGKGRVKEVDFQPEEWPPRREGF
jgi:hypothetical protein